MLFSLIPNFRSMRKRKTTFTRAEKQNQTNKIEITKIKYDWNVIKGPLRMIIRIHFISRAFVFLIRPERIEAFSALLRSRKGREKKEEKIHFWYLKCVNKFQKFKSMACNYVKEKF